jgi:hypothetical protein
MSSLQSAWLSEESEGDGSDPLPPFTREDEKELFDDRLENRDTHFRRGFQYGIPRDQSSRLYSSQTPWTRLG